MSDDRLVCRLVHHGQDVPLFAFSRWLGWLARTLSALDREAGQGRRGRTQWLVVGMAMTEEYAEVTVEARGPRAGAVLHAARQRGIGQ